MPRKFDFSQEYLVSYLQYLSIINKRGLIPHRDCLKAANDIGAILLINESDSVEYVHELWDKEKLVQKYFKK